MDSPGGEDRLVREWFSKAVALPAEARAALLAGSPLSSDQKQRLEELLDADPGSDTFFRNTIASEAPPALGIGERFGAYETRALLGRGGMGVVFMAERVDGEFSRLVALKLPSAIYDASFLERFRRERDILASLTHANIAQIYDAGATPQGQPFIALEYVEGSTLLEYCDRGRLGIRERLKLFLQVLGAVHYAHTHMVVHRDLKPGNILVTKDGVVKLLDFGIAKLLNDPAEADLTRVGGNVLTRDYASPEQILGKPVSTASDVYSLGVVLCELLTGRRPMGSRPAEASLETRRPSQLAKESDTPKSRNTTSKRLAAILAGDLDTIILKALQPEPADRYASADAFAQDLQRYLSGEPVLAQPEAATYRMKKFILRHKVGVLASLAVAIALMGGLGLALWQARVASREAQTARAVETFLENIFLTNSAGQADPVKARQTSARELLDIGARKISGELGGATEAKYNVLTTLALMYNELGVYEDALKLHRQRVTAAQALYGAQSREMAAALVDLGNAMHATKSVSERKAVLSQAKDLLDRQRDFTSEARGALDRALAQDYENVDLNKAAEFAHQAVELYRRNKNDRGLIQALYVEGLTRNDSSEWAQALPLFSEMIQLSKRVEGDPNPELPKGYAYQGEAYSRLMQFAAAEESLRNAYEVACKLNGAEHVDAVQTESRLGYFQAGTSHLKEAVEHLSHANQIALKTLGPDDPFTVPQVQYRYGSALARHGRVKEGIEQIARAIQNRRKNRPDDLFLARMLEAKASALLDMGSKPEAQKLAEEAAEIRTRLKQEPDQADRILRVKFLLAASKADEAARLLRTATGPLSLNDLREMTARAEVAAARKNWQETAAIASQARQQIVAGSGRAYLKEDEASLALLEGRAYLGLDRPADALPLLKSAVELRTEILDPRSPSLAESQTWLAAAQHARR